MSDQAIITVVEQKEVDFHGDEVTAVLTQDDTIYVPLRPICDFLEIDWSAQFRRINRDAILSQKVENITISVADSHRTVGREMACIPLEYLNGWLFGIHANRVKEEVRDKVLRYQDECYRILYQAFQIDVLSAMGQVQESDAIRSLQHIREMGLAIARMAEEQIELERRVTRSEQRLDAAATVVLNIRNRLTAVEQRVLPGNPISEEQATEVAQLVKAIANARSEHDKGKNHYQAIWGELYRRFNVSSYKLIPQSKFGAVIAFLQAEQPN